MMPESGRAFGAASFAARVAKAIRQEISRRSGRGETGKNRGLMKRAPIGTDRALLDNLGRSSFEKRKVWGTLISTLPVAEPSGRISSPPFFSALKTASECAALRFKCKRQLARHPAGGNLKGDDVGHVAPKFAKRERSHVLLSFLKQRRQ